MGRLAVAGWLSHILLVNLVCTSTVAAQDEGPSNLTESKASVRLLAQTGHREPIDAVAISDDSRLVLTGGKDGVRLWEASSGSELQYIPDIVAQSLAISPSSRYAAVANQSGAALWDLSSGSLVPGFRVVGQVRSVAFSPDGALLLTGIGNAAALWNVETGAVVRRFLGHSGNVLHAAFSTDGQSIVTSSADKTVRLWSTESGVEIRRFEGSTHEVNSAALSSDGGSVLGACRDGTARIWDASTGAIRFVHDPHRPDWFSRGVAFLHDGRSVVGVESQGIVIWDSSTGETTRRFDGVAGPYVISTDGRLLFASRTSVRPGFISQMVMVEIDTGRVVSTLEHYAHPVEGVAWAPDNRTLLTANSNSGAVLWDLDAGTPRCFTADSDIGRVVGAAFSPDGNRMLLAESGGRVDSAALRLVEVKSGVELGRVVPGKTRGVPMAFRPRAWNGLKVAFSGNGRFVAVAVRASDDLTEPGGTALWDTSSGNVRLFFGRGDVSSVALSPDGRWLLAGGYKGVVGLWDTDSGDEVRSFEVHSGSVSSVGFSPDGRSVLTTGSGTTPRLWDIVTGAEVVQFQPDPYCTSGTVTYATFAAGGQFVVGRGDRARVWDAQTGRLVRSGKVRSLSNEVPSFDERLGASSEGCITVLRDLVEGRELCRLVAFRDGGWAVIDPSGRFDASTIDGIRGLHWIVSAEPFKPLPIEIFMRQYYEPGLLPRLLSGEVLPPVPDLLSLDRRQPSVHVADITPSSGTPGAVDVRVEVAAASRVVREGEVPGRAAPTVHDLRLFRDGRLVGCEPRTDGRVTLDADGKATVVFRGIRLPHNKESTKVEFSAYAFNGDRVKSATDRRVYPLEPSPDKVKGRAYVVSIGVNTYDDPSLNLRYAVNDAVELSSVVSDALTRTGAYEDVVAVPLISDGSRLSAATKADVRAALSLLAGLPVSPGAAKRIPNVDRIRPARPDDLVVITFAGHGYSDGRGNFYMVPSDVGRNARAQIAAMGDGQPEALGRCISSDELSRWLRDVDAGEMVMVIDACQSAAFTGPGFKPGPMGSRGLGQLAFDKRMKILATTQSDNVALEVAKLEHGLATYVLVNEGIEAAEADYKPKDAAIFLGEWLGYAVERVPGLQAEIESGKVRAIGKTQPRVVVRDATLRTNRDITHEAPTRLVQRPVLFDFSRDESDVLLTHPKSPPAP